ncbi:MAG TPA: acyloxyacyl hydrolase [Steroidobacteraceae bacterium]|jgi:lipid A 3-O-deacylase|nr:acyloxyacyl hydrolase [Steroidobacteraceae bacterium]
MGCLRRLLLGALLAAACAATAHADAVRVTVGYGQGADLYAIAVQLDRRAPLHQYARWTLTSHLDLGVSEFQGHRSSSHYNTTHALAVVPKLRWQRTATPAVTPFIEFGLGLSGFTETTIAGTRHLGGDFEFTELLRTGLSFGGRRQYEIALTGQHFSNGGLNHPNDGITYAGISLAWYFR